MGQRISEARYDVVVLGGGSAGVAAAVAAARNGARTVLVDAGPMIGGELLSGIPVDGCVSTSGEWVVGGIVRELFDACDKMGGYIGPIDDFRSLHVVAVDPEVMKLAVVRLVHAAGVALLLYTFADDVVVADGVVQGLVVLNKNQRTLLRGRVFLDCSGDADLAVGAGAPFELGQPGSGELQPVSLIFRMMGVETEPLLRFVRAHPEHFGLAEHSARGLTPAQAAEGLYRQGLPKVFLVAEGPLLGGAIARGEMYPTSMIGVTPVSLARKEVSLNTTRLANLDATRTDALSRALPDLVEQVWQAVGFLRRCVPGFETAVYSGLAPRIGIRETRRTVGECVLTGPDILDARKREDGIAKGAHELDVHRSGTGHTRATIKDGGSYDIPFGCLVPQRLRNVLVAGRCLSATREAHSSARVMGTCLAMGQAAGTAAALAVTDPAWTGDVRALDVRRLRDVLRMQGAVLEGTR